MCGILELSDAELRLYIFVVGHHALGVFSIFELTLRLCPDGEGGVVLLPVLMAFLPFTFFESAYIYNNNK